MFNGGDHFKHGNITSNKSSPLQLIQSFSIDVGRFDFESSWVNKIRLFIFPLFLLITGLGPVMIETDDMDSISKSIYNIFKYIIILTPEDSSFTIILSLNLAFLIVYISLIIFLLYLINLYRDNSCPTTFQVKLWAVISRIIMPIFTPYFSHIFSKSLYDLLFGNSTDSSISSFVISIPLLLIQFLYIFFSCSVYNATPIIRNNDASQLWYSMSSIDWLLNLVLFLQVFLQNILFIASQPARSITFAVFIIVLSFGFGIMIFHKLPYIRPQTNCIVLAAAFSAPFCSILPLISHYVHSGDAIGLAVVIIIVILNLIICRALVNHRIKKILFKFDILQEEEEDATDLDPLRSAFIQLIPPQEADFSLLNIKGAAELSLYLRIGYLFGQQDVNNQNFIKWALDQNSKTDLILSACQISYSIQNNVRILNTLEQCCHKLSNAPYNYRSFVILFNHLRQELLTQLNQPLLEAIGKAKKSTHNLQSKIAEYWGSVLKQKVDAMLSILPDISSEMIKTDILYERLLRNYSKSPTVYRETVLFYHKSLGEHHKTLDAQSNYNKYRNSNSNSDSTDESTSTSYANVDNDFKDRMESWVAAQNVIDNLPVTSLKWLIALIILVFCAAFIVPIIILAVSLHDISDFQATIEPVQTIGMIEHDISRIPQLLRRKQLWKLGEVGPWIENTGPPLGTILEFITEEEIIPTVEVYSEEISRLSEKFLTLCTKGSAIYDSCLNMSHKMENGDSVSETSVYNMITTFNSMTEAIYRDPTFDWENADKSTNFLFLFQNMDELYSSVSDMLLILRHEIIGYKDYFKIMTIVWLVLIWAFPVLFITPLIVLTIYFIKRDFNFKLKLFFQLPKSEISALRWSNKSKKRKSHNIGPSQPAQSINETSSNSLFDTPNERNEDMIDNLATIPRKTTSLYFNFILCLVIIILFVSIMTSIGIVVFNTSMSDIIEMSNGYVEAIEITSGCLASYVWTQEIFTMNPLLYNVDELKSKGNAYIEQFTSMFDTFLYGGNKSFTAGILLGQDVIDTYIVSNIVQSHDNYIIDPVYGVLHEVYFSMSCESQMRLLTELSLFIFSHSQDAIVLSFADEFVYHYEHLLFSHLDTHLQNGRALFSQKTVNLSQTKTDQIILVFVVMFIVQFIYLISILLGNFFTLKHHIMTPHILLKLVNPDALLKSQTIVKWFSGILTPATRIANIENRDHTPVGFSDFVVQHSKCGLIITNDSTQVVKINDAVCTLFKIEEKDIVDANIIEFLSQRIIDNDRQNIIRHLEHQTKKMKNGTSRDNRYHISASIIGANSQVVFLSISLVGYNDDGDDADDRNDYAPPARAFSVILYDRTTEHYQEALVESEKKKSETLITSLMPASIIKRLNDGETDISFEVQKTTILFASVYEWSKLISNMSAVQVVSFLNKLFSGYDEELENFPTITKLKTIGHIYMIACGLFSDLSVNSAQIMTEYALKMLQIVDNLGKELDLNFQITVGLNTGPINCGILGHTRPVFDIIGDSVNVASRMNSSGVPGLLQISETTYEDIKFLKFNIRERGEIQIKGKGLRKTYLVSLPTEPKSSDK
ncbi:Adenylate and Guanylate cyclase catalytic domain containing protein [Tritrichomonas foetus]|uniref:Adenylate and Guanylate cyclase catalytic domain containing protein n=1 Tax=Tritrichomonas foetus TaxID=1144522 RepID=A0A1J4JGF0_9EUKA|nr:Adenylate and Guanylate cyclase catalytic domain containing protein [Tritrichomonas foetus]|eukprot:OHS98232.1 Adenylate and Guanylate cyclase catalytic domain containing protein [Tritrichomonas foetus]